MVSHRSDQRLSRRQFLTGATAAAVACTFNVPVARGEPRMFDRTRVSPLEGRVIKLFNGKDLAGFYPWLKDALYEDPRKVFSVRDGRLRISGEVNGYLATTKEYRDYHLEALRCQVRPLSQVLQPCRIQ